MKKLLSLLGVIAAAGLLTAPAYGADHYVSGNIGMSWFNDSSIKDYSGGTEIAELNYSSGITVLGAIGCDYGSYRLEAEIGYQKNDIDALVTPDDSNMSLTADATTATAGEMSVLSLMANGYYDIDAGGFEPYLTAGVGVAQVNIDDFRPETADEDTGYTVHETTLAYQLGAGVAIPIGSNVMLDARYRYFATTEFSSILLGNMDVSSHNALLGLRIGF
jgi:opacity protein-like surface antigen